MNPDDINADLTSELVPPDGTVESVEVPQSNQEQAPSLDSYKAESFFVEDKKPEGSPEEFFSQEAVPTPIIVTADKRPVATMMTSLVTADDPVMALMQENLQMAGALLDSQKEAMIRIGIAKERIMDTAMYLNNYKKSAQEMVRQGTISPESAKLIDDTYQGVIERNAIADAELALEYETVDRVRDMIRRGDPHEAKILLDLEENGSADKRMIDMSIRGLILAQRREELVAEYEDSGWVRFAFNILTYLLPGRANFDKAGILTDAKVPNQVSGFMNGLLSGTGMSEQGIDLFSLNNEEFAAAMAKNGPVMAAIRENAGLFTDDPGMALATFSGITGARSDVLGDGNLEITSEGLQNIFGVSDVVLGLPFVTAFKVPGLLTRMGARKAAVDQIARGVIELSENGPNAARAATGMSADEIAAASLPTALNPNASGLGLDALATADTVRAIREELPDIIAANKFTSADEIVAAFETLEKEYRGGKYGNSIKDVKYLEENVPTGNVAPFVREVSEDNRTIRTVEFTVGKKDGGGYATKSGAIGSMERFGFKETGETFQDDAGQWFGKFRVALPEDGFITSPLLTPDHSWLNYLRSTSRISDASLMGKALVGGNSANLFETAVTRALALSMKGLSGKQKNTIMQIGMKGQNEGKFYSREEFNTLYRDLAGRDATREDFTSYSTFRNIKDLEYSFRNDELYRLKGSQGYESVRFTSKQGDERDVDAIVVMNPKSRPNGKIWDATNSRFLEPSDDIEQMSAQGFVLMKLDQDISIGKNSITRLVMAKTSNIERRALRRTQLNYSEGGSRAYTAKHFAKQTSKDPDGALRNPKTMIAGRNLNELKGWVADMNEAIGLVRAGKPSAADIDEIFKGRAGYPTGEKFLRQVEDGEISLKHDIEVVRDGQLPRDYQGQNEFAMRNVDLGETDLQAYYRSQGRMYYSNKGEALLDETGNFAETLNPWEALNKSLSEVARTVGLSGYKQAALERLRGTYGQYLTATNKGSLYDLVNSPIERNISKELTSQIKNEQAAIARILNFETGFEKSVRENTDSIADWVLGGGRSGSLREKASNSVYWIKDNNPVSFLRGLAFDAKLGMFNPVQLFIQMSTMASATALNPKYGFKGMMLAPSMKAIALSGFKPNVIDVLAKRGVWKGVFDSEAEFRAFSKMAASTGLLEVSGRTLSQISELGPNRVFGATSKIDAGREAGRTFFYTAEQMNRIVAARISWGIAKDKGLKEGTAQFRESFMKNADDYSMNMMAESSAGFQKGILSIPTQFWAYGFRMMDALVGKRFTTAQKARLLAANFVMGGAAGVPGGSLLASWIEQRNGKPMEPGEADWYMKRGFFDGLAYLATESDVEIGKRVGTADMIPNIIKDLFGVGDYGEKSFMEMAGGATGSITMTALPTLAKVFQYTAIEAGGDGTGIAGDYWESLAREISTANNAFAMYYALQYQTYYTKNMDVLKDDVPTAEAFFYGIGFTPGANSDRGFYLKKTSEDGIIEEGSKLVSKWRQESFTIPDKFDENRNKVEAFLSLHPPHVRVKILERAKAIVDPSMIDLLARKHREEAEENAAIDMFDPSLDNPETNYKLDEQQGEF